MLVEALIAAVGVLAGLTTVAWNVMQMRMARRAQELDQETAEWQAAVTIQRAYRVHRSTRMRYGAFEMEWSSEQLPTGLPTSPTSPTSPTGRAADSDSDSEDSPQPRKGGYWFR
jgi:type II secretory pathway pseudopilin PulG